MDKINLKGMTVKEIKDFIERNKEKPFRAEQIFEWICRGVSNFDFMTNLPKDLRLMLKQKAYIGELQIVKKKADRDKTVKYLFLLEDKNVVESVFMKYGYGNSVCLSSQVGCKMGCVFCASTIGGCIRNLKKWEIFDQLIQIQNDLGEKHRITHLVIMGSGEPLENYNEVIGALKLIHEGKNISFRRMTLSTCGIIPGIEKLARENLPITLSVSLHAPTDELRNRLMPINKIYPISPLIKACKYYINITKRRITFEYALIKGINDSPKEARLLAEILKNLLCHVNLININPVKERGFEQPDKKTVQTFKNILEKEGINVTIRRELGIGIDAGCGQLRRRYLD